MKVTYVYADRTVTVNTVSKSYQYEHKKTTITVLLDFYEAGLIYKLNIIDASGEKNESHIMTYAGTENGKHKYTSELWVENTTYAGEILMSMSIEENDNGEIVERWTGETFEKYINATPGPHNTDLDPTVDALVLDDIYAQLSAKLNITHKGYYNTVELGVTGTTLLSYVDAIHAALVAFNFEGLARVRIKGVVTDADFDEITVYINSDNSSAALIDGYYHDQPLHYYNLYYNSTLQGWRRYLTEEDLVPLVRKDNLYFSAGATTQPTLTNNGGGNVTINACCVALYDNTENVGIPEKYDLSAITVTLTDQTLNYIVADYNAGSPILRVTLDVNEINESSVVPIFSIERTGNILHTLDWDKLGLGMVNKIHMRLVKTERFRRESGLALSVVGTRVLHSQAGVAWYGAKRQTLEAVQSDTDSLYIYRHVAGDWVGSVATQFANDVYDNGTDLVELTNNRYAVVWVFRGVETAKHLYAVYGTGNYLLPAALESDVPPIPQQISSHAILVGRVIIQKGSNTPYTVQSAFTATFSAASVQSHGDLVDRDLTDQHPIGAITNLETTLSDLNNADINTFTYNGTTGVVTITLKSGATKTVDLPLELLISSGYWDEANNDLVLVLANGNEVKIPFDALDSKLQGLIANKVDKDIRGYTTHSPIIDNDLLPIYDITGTLMKKVSAAAFASYANVIIGSFVATGDYPQLTAGFARYLIPTTPFTDTATYAERITAGNSNEIVQVGGKKAKLSKVQGYSAVVSNLVTNGDFSNGTTGWTIYSNSTYVYVDNNILNIIASGGINIDVGIRQELSTNTNDVIRYEIKYKGYSLVQNLDLRHTDYNTNNNFSNIVTLLSINETKANYTTVKGIFNAKTGGSRIQIFYYVTGTRALNVQIDNIQFINLTDMVNKGLISTATNQAYETWLETQTTYKVGDYFQSINASVVANELKSIGENKLKLASAGATINGITYDINETSVLLKGTATAQTDIEIGTMVSDGTLTYKVGGLATGVTLYAGTTQITTNTTLAKGTHVVKLRVASGTSLLTTLQPYIYYNAHALNVFKPYVEEVITLPNATLRSKYDTGVMYRDYIDFESYNIVRYVHADGSLLATPTVTPFTPIDSEYVAYNYGTEVFTLGTPMKPTATTKYVRDVVTQADTNTEYIKELQDKVVELESAIQDISDDLTLEINAIKDELDNIELQLWSGSQTIAEMTPTYNFPMRRQYVSTKIKVTASIGANNITGIATLNGSGVGTVTPDLFPATTYNINSQSAQMTISHGLAGDVIVTKIELVDDLQTSIDEVVEIIDNLPLGDTNTIEEIATSEGVLTPSVSKRVTIPVDQRTCFLIWAGTQQIDNNDQWVDIAGTQYLIGLTRVRVELTINSGTYEAILTTEGTTAGVLDGDTFGDATNIRVNSSTHRIEMQVINEIGVTTLTQIRAFIHY